jgi:long-subunit fatty acid transport protein
VRAGFLRSPSPYRNAEYMPDKEYYTAGASLQLDKQVMVDVGLVHGVWEKTTRDNLTKYDTLENISYDKIIGTLSIRY